MTTQALDLFQEHRDLLFGIAYRMLGTVMDAQDMVQETFLRWQRTSLDEVKSPRAWLTTVITRLCINHLKSARVQRETYYFKIELTIAKILGVLALLMPNVPTKAKEFAHFGFGITLISASIAHFSIGDGIQFIIDPLLFLGALIVSYWYFNKMKSNQNALSQSSVLRSGR
jgi:RNA polymerase sigma factor (sigma-70 family)